MSDETSSENRPALHLSPRERQCLDLLARGCKLKDAALALGISLRTVDIHLANARDKLNATTSEQAVVVAMRAGLIPYAPDPSSDAAKGGKIT